MKQRLPRRALSLAIVATSFLTSWGPGTAARAQSVQVSRDRSDNRHSFEWDADRDTLGAQSSSALTRAGDPVTFYTFARTWSRPDTNSPLVAQLTFSLNQGVHRARRYDGLVIFKVLNVAGKVVRTRAKPKRFTLRPGAGERRFQTRFWFNLPSSGTYDIVGRFRSV